MGGWILGLDADGAFKEGDGLPGPVVLKVPCRQVVERFRRRVLAGCQLPVSFKRGGVVAGLVHVQGQVVRRLRVVRAQLQCDLVFIDGGVVIALFAVGLAQHVVGLRIR